MKPLTNIPIKNEKLAKLNEQIQKLNICLDDIEEKHLPVGGKGGQKANRTAVCVQLKHLPTGKIFTASDDRSLSVNRFLALRKLVEFIESGSTISLKKQKQIDKIRKQKKRRKRRSKDTTMDPNSPPSSS